MSKNRAPVLVFANPKQPIAVKALRLQALARVNPRDAEIIEKLIDSLLNVNAKEGEGCGHEQSPQ